MTDETCVREELRGALMGARRPSSFFEELRETGRLKPWFLEVEALIGVPQNPCWHPEGDVWTHTMLVLDAAAGMRDEAREPLGLMMAALCHDLGKATTTRELEGRIVSYGHERAGVALADSLLARLGTGGQVRAYVLNMVELHMAPNALVAQRAGAKSYNRLFDRSVCPHDLLLLARADELGCGDGRERPAARAELRRRLADFEELMARPYVRECDLRELGIEEGPLLEEVLRHAHKLRLAGLSREDQLRQCVGFWRHLQS